MAVAFVEDDVRESFLRHARIECQVERVNDFAVGADRGKTSAAQGADLKRDPRIHGHERSLHRRRGAPSDMRQSLPPKSSCSVCRCAGAIPASLGGSPATRLGQQRSRLSPVKLALTLLAKNEADIVDANVAYHLAAGVDFVVATDNGSSDGTTRIFERYEQRGVLAPHPRAEQRLSTRPLGDARMARRAAELGADWVMNADADEFWWPRAGDLKEALERAIRRLRRWRGIFFFFLCGVYLLRSVGVALLSARPAQSPRKGDDQAPAERAIYWVERSWRPMSSRHNSSQPSEHEVVRSFRRRIERTTRLSDSHTP